MTEPGRLAALEAEIGRRIREFEVPALLDLLDVIGYPPARVEFRGHLSYGPQPTLLRAIEFPNHTAAAHVEPKVVVTVNLGLLSCRSPLPTYFRRFLDDMDTRDGLLELLLLLDRSLLHARLTCDGFGRTIDDWAESERDFVRSLGLDTPLGLEWLFRRVFPELGVVVRRIADERRLPFDSAALGLCKLGECSFGRLTRIGVHDIEVTLICEDATVDGERTWVVEGDRRLRSVVFPLLDEVCMSLTVGFVLLDHRSRAELGPSHYAGYDPMWDDASLVASNTAAHIELYRGLLPRDEPNTDRLELELSFGEDVAGELSIDRYAPAIREHAIGRELVLQLQFVAPGRRHVYAATVQWGARAWYRDEPRTIELRCRGIRKAPVTARAHPRLWARLCDEARRRLADHLTHEVMATVEHERVTVELVEELIGRGKFEHLHALVWSELTPMAAWDDEAWQRYSSWSRG